MTDGAKISAWNSIKAEEESRIAELKAERRNPPVFPFPEGRTSDLHIPPSGVSGNNVLNKLSQGSEVVDLFRIGVQRAL